MRTTGLKRRERGWVWKKGGLSFPSTQAWEEALQAAGLKILPRPRLSCILSRDSLHPSDIPSNALPLSPQDLMAEMAWASVRLLRQEACQVRGTGQGRWGYRW